jgi:hypothetical protein
MDAAQYYSVGHRKLREGFTSLQEIWEEWRQIRRGDVTVADRARGVTAARVWTGGHTFPCS